MSVFEVPSIAAGGVKACSGRSGVRSISPPENEALQEAPRYRGHTLAPA